MPNNTLYKLKEDFLKEWSIEKLIIVVVKI